jgi:hypothetical protein
VVAELKASESDAGSESESEPDKGNDRGKQIIDTEPNSTVATMKILKKEPEIQRRQNASSIPRCG